MRKFIEANVGRGLILLGSGVGMMTLGAWAGTLLRIQKGDEGEIVLSWPVTEEEYVVESSRTLANGWRKRGEPVVEDNGRRQMTVDAFEVAEFFRLRAPEVSSRVARGGALYDKWWAVTGDPAPESDHPLWTSRPDQASNTRTGADTWRCKECHGWDYKGVDGVYGAGSHRTGIGGIFATTRTPQQIFDLVKTGHGYGAAGLSDEDIQDLTEFVLQGQIDTGKILDQDRRFTGDPGRGEALYSFGIRSNTSCLHCHGEEGLSIPPDSSEEFEEFPGLLSNENPWEFQHKVRFGHPGSEMPAAFAVGITVQEVADVAAYCQLLPATRP